MSLYANEYKGTDYVYYNAMLTNNKDVPIEARITEYRSEPIVINPKDYYLSVVRFNVPVSLIPIFIYPTLPSPPNPINTPDNTQYSVTLLDSLGAYHKVNLIYTYLDVVSGPPNVYTVQHFLDMINTALATAHTAMGGLKPATPPYITFNQETKLFALIGENGWNISTNLGIFMNSKLFLFFDYLESRFNGYNLLNGTDFQIMFKNNGNNSLSASQITPPNGSIAVNPGYILKQEQASLDKWSQVRSIIFVSNTISVKPEYITASPDLLQNTGDNFRSILTDFEPPLITGEVFRGYLQYYPQGPYRLIDMTTDTNLKNIDFQLFWQDNKQRINKIYINHAESITVKLMFVKKDAYKANPNMLFK